MEELKKDIENLNKKFERIEDKFNGLMETISKTIEKQNEAKVCCEEVPHKREREILFKTYEIVKRMNFEEEKRIWEERAKEVDAEIKELERRKECCSMELREISDRYYRE